MRTPIPLSARSEHLLPAGLGAELNSFLLSLEAENLAPKTRRTYADAVDQLGRFLVGRGMPTDVGAIRREHVEAFIADQVARRRPNTARNRYLALKRFFAWLLDEGLIEMASTTSSLRGTLASRVGARRERARDQDAQCTG
jgi:site-specific recombinase XerD